jgi:hypothetical protein
MKIQVTHTTSASTPDKAKTYRVTVRPVSYIDRSHYYELSREGSEWFEERFSMPMDTDIEDNVEAITLRNLVYFRAEMLAAVDRERTADGTVYMCEYKNGVEDAQFEKAALPADWMTLDGMADEMPPAFSDEWLDATRKLNAGVLPTVPDFFGFGATISSVID